MKVSEKLLVFVQDKKAKENRTFKTFSTNVSSKNDEEYINKSIEVRFNTENIPQEALNKMDSSKCYELEVEDGWLGVRKYTNEAGEERKVLYVYVDKASVKSAKPIKKAPENNDLPF